MKKYINMLLSTTLVLVCHYPQNLKIMGSEFSTGSSKSPGYMVELSGIENKQYVTYTDYILSTGKIFGMGRIAAPDKIIFKKSNTTKMNCK